MVARARGEGHEILLQVPMEPFGYPDNDPGPQTLLTSLTPEQNLDRLYWLMSRFQGYVGIVGAMGARFTASEPSFAPILRETAKRGLIFVDDGSNPRSVAGRIAGANNLPFAKADVILDSVPTPAEIEHALGRLEMAAREHGVAVGIASALPVSIEHIAKWAKARGEPRPAAGSDHRGRPEGEAELRSCANRRSGERAHRLGYTSPLSPAIRTSPVRSSRMILRRSPLSPLRRPDLVLNRAGLAFIGRRIGGPEHVDDTHVWQMPQGGIDPGEDPWPAALRELREETTCRSVERLGEIAEWLNYDIPREIVGHAWSGKYRGQTQKWFALRFTGDDSEINIEHPAGGHEPEFVAWRWEPLQNLPDLVVPFKRAVYERVVAEFQKFA